MGPAKGRKTVHFSIDQCVFAPPRRMAAPRISQLGGGIRKDQVGASTVAYEEYFDGDHGAGALAGNAERTGNYADVVNKCVARHTAAAWSHTLPAPAWASTRPVGSGPWPPQGPLQLTSFGPPGRLATQVL